MPQAASLLVLWGAQAVYDRTADTESPGRLTMSCSLTIWVMKSAHRDVSELWLFTTRLRPVHQQQTASSTYRSITKTP